MNSSLLANLEQRVLKWCETYFSHQLILSLSTYSFPASNQEMDFADVFSYFDKQINKLEKKKPRLATACRSKANIPLTVGILTKF